MQNIVPEILTLDQYLKLQKEEPERFRPSYCPCCGKTGLWFHGHYDRKSDRGGTSMDTNNPVPILRFFCPHCNCTSSVLPECIPLKRWYLWSVQQAAIALVLAGKSLVSAAKEMALSRHAISRWVGRLKERFRFHKDVLNQHFIDLGRTDSFVDFWLVCFSKIPLSQAMRLCHVAGVNIP